MSEALGNTIVHAQGRVTAAELAYAHAKIGRLADRAPGLVLGARVDLIAHLDPARERPALAKAELNLDGKLVRAHADGETMPAAIDLLQARLRERLERVVEHERSKHLRHRGHDAGWRHGQDVHPRPTHYPRPVEEREVVRRKTYALDDVTPEAAALELEALDHDFYLFRNAVTGEDNVIRRITGGCYELMQPFPEPLAEPGANIDPSTLRPSVMSVEVAEELLDLSDAPFVFFIDATTDRGQVLYRRYDGHYGLVLAASGTKV